MNDVYNISSVIYFCDVISFTEYKHNLHIKCIYLYFFITYKYMKFFLKLPIIEGPHNKGCANPLAKKQLFNIGILLYSTFIALLNMRNIFTLDIGLSISFVNGNVSETMNVTTTFYVA